MYLQDNMLVELNGSLRHLTCLQVLLLNGNQLIKLTDVVHELRAMQCLKTLSMCLSFQLLSLVKLHVSTIEKWLLKDHELFRALGTCMCPFTLSYFVVCYIHTVAHSILSFYAHNPRHLRIIISIVTYNL